MSKREWSASDQIQRHGDGDSISRGVGGLDDNRVYGDSVSGSVGSRERCIHTIVTSLSTWSQESREYLAEIAKNIEEGDIIYWVQGLCANREKSLALGERGLEGLDRAILPEGKLQ